MNELLQSANFLSIDHSFWLALFGIGILVVVMNCIFWSLKPKK